MDRPRGRILPKDVRLSHIGVIRRVGEGGLDDLDASGGAHRRTRLVERRDRAAAVVVEAGRGAGAKPLNVDLGRDGRRDVKRLGGDRAAGHIRACALRPGDADRAARSIGSPDGGGIGGQGLKPGYRFCRRNVPGIGEDIAWLLHRLVPFQPRAVDTVRRDLVGAGEDDVERDLLCVGTGRLTLGAVSCPITG